MINDKVNQLNQKLSKLLELSKEEPNTLEPLLEKLLESLNVETDAARGNAERVRELAALSALGEHLSSAATSTSDAILKIVYEQTSLLMQTKNFYVAFYDRNHDMVSFPFVREKGKARKQVGDYAPRKTGKGLTEYIIRNPTPLYIPKDVDKWMLKHRNYVTRTGEPAKSWLGVPMITRDELIGVITVQDYEKEDIFDTNDRDVLSTIANQAAIAIVNSRLFQSNQRQAEEAAQFRKVSQAITSTIDLSKVLKQVVQGARKVMNVDLVILYPIIQGRFEPAISDGKTFVKHELGYLPRPDGLASKVLKQGFLSVDDLEDQPEMISKFVQEEKIRSVAGIALRVGGEVVGEEIVGGESVGVLYFNYRRLQSFGKMERNTIHLFAAQAATAIQNARLFDRRARDFKAIERINQAITTQTLDRVLQEILEAAIEIIKVPTGHVLQVDESGQYLEIKAYQSPTISIDPQKKYEIGKEGVSGWVAKHKRSVMINDVNDPKWKNIYMVATADTKSSLTVPLIDANRELLGIINLESDRPDAFTENDQDLLEAFAKQASIAITNRKHYEIEQRTREEAEALSEISKTISSKLVLKDVLQVILDKGLELAGHGRAKGSISLYDKFKNELWVAVQRGISEELIETRQKISKGIVGLAGKKMQPILVADVKDTKWKKIYEPFIPDMRSELAVPLIQDGKLIGVFNMEHPEVGHFKPKDEQLLRKLGDHAVIAINNAKQYEQLNALREIDQAIISASNKDQVLNLILDNALQLIGAEIGEISLVDTMANQLVSHASRLPKGVDVDETFTNLPLEKGISGWCVANMESIIIPDTRKDDRYIPYFKGMRSELVVPLLAEKYALGVVSLESPQIAVFDEKDMQTLQRLAGQAVIAIQQLDAINAQRVAEQQVIEAKSMSEIGKMAFEIAHRLGNDLGKVRSYRNNILDKLENLKLRSPYIEEELEKIVSDVKKVLDLSTQLKAQLMLSAFSGTKENKDIFRERVITSVGKLLNNVAAGAYGPLPKNITVKIEVAEDVKPIYVQPDQIADILRNLFTNAIQAMPEGGKIMLRARNVDEFVEIQVEDTGTGIESAVLPHIFDFLYSTKGSSGFGLWSSRGNAVANGGELQVESQLGSGTTFTLMLPIGIEKNRSRK